MQHDTVFTYVIFSLVFFCKGGGQKGSESYVNLPNTEKVLDKHFFYSCNKHVYIYTRITDLHAKGDK